MLKANGYYSFTRKDGSTVHLIFNTWAFKKFCERKNLSLNDLFQMLGGSIGLHDFVDLIYCASLSYGAKMKVETLNEYDLTEVLDEVSFFSDTQMMGDLGNAIRQWLEPNLPSEPKTDDEEEKKS